MEYIFLKCHCQTQTRGFMNFNNFDFKNYNTEIKRKAFHCMSIIFPLFYLISNKLTMVMVLTVVTGIAVSLDISRHYNAAIQELVNKFFTTIMREDETSGNFKLSGVSYMFLGFFITCILFSKGIAISAFLVLIVSDTVAALVGKKIGKPMANGKSIEGSIAFGASAILIGILSYTFQTYGTTFSGIIVAAIITTLVEYHTDKININDNLSIPVTFGLVVTILGWM